MSHDPVAATARPPRDGRVRRAVRRVFPRTLAGRLLAGVLTLVVVVVLGVGAGTYVLLRPFLLQRLDSQLSPIARSNTFAISHCLSDLSASGTCDFGNGQVPRSPQTEWLNAYNTGSGDAALIQSFDTTDLRVLDLPGSTLADLISDPGRARTVTTTDGVPLRVVAQPLNNLVVVTGLSTDEVTNTLHRLLLLELAIGGVAVAVAILATGYGVGAALRPLNRVRRTATDVAAELSPDGAGLDRRVPVGPDDVASEAGQVAIAVNTMLGAVEAQFAARVASEDRMRQFLADASHELRTPLTSIRGYAELSRLRGDQGTDAETLQRIEAEGTRMSRLVEDLFLLARHDDGVEAEPQLVELGELADQAVEGARVSFPDRPITARTAEPVAVWGDPDQLLRVVRNLINNAAVHTAPGGPIAVLVRAEGRDGVLQVIDAGPGLPPEDAAHVFERFWRADKARTRARGGSGLGLSIVGSLVQAHGGVVDFASSVEHGSTVTVRLPRAQ